MDGIGVEVLSSLVDVLDPDYITLNKDVTNIAFSKKWRVLLQLVFVDLRQWWQVVHRLRSVKEFIWCVERSSRELAGSCFLLAHLASFGELDVFVFKWAVHICDIRRPKQVGILGCFKLCEFAVDHDSELIGTIFSQTNDVKSD